MDINYLTWINLVWPWLNINGLLNHIDPPIPFLHKFHLQLGLPCWCEVGGDVTSQVAHP
jgi:hypothetical protein